MLEDRLAGLLELAEAGAVGILIVVGALDEGFAGDVVAAGDLGRVEGGVVDAARGLVDPATGNAVDDDGQRGLEGDDEVDGDDLAEDVSLGGGAGEAVEDEGGGRVFGGLRGRVVVEEVGVGDEGVGGAAERGRFEGGGAGCFGV